MKSFIARAAKQIGYHIVPDWRMQHLDFARHLAKLFNHFKVSCVLDVGANKGQYRDFLRMEVGFNGRIISFEPVRSTYEFLLERAKSDCNWEIHNCALGNQDGKMTINVMTSSSLTSFLEPDQSHLHLQNNIIQKKESVSIHKLETVATELNLYTQTNFYLKLDTQGYDLEACRGAKKFLPHIIAIQSEMSVIPIYHNMANYLESIKYLNSLGYMLSAMFPVKLNDNMHLVEFDCVLVRDI